MATASGTAIGSTEFMALWRDKPTRAHLAAIGARGKHVAEQSLRKLEHICVVDDYLASNVTMFLSPNTAKSWRGKTFLNHLLHKAEHPESAEMVDSKIMKGFWAAIGGQA